MQKQVLITQALSPAGIALTQSFRQEGWYVFGLDQHDNFSHDCNRFILFDPQAFASDSSYRIKMSSIFEELIRQLHALVFFFESPKDLHRHLLDLEGWQQALDFYLTTPLLLTKLFAERLKKSKGHILSLIDSTPPKKAETALASLPIRDALQGLTLAIAKDWAPQVCANVITYQWISEKNTRPKPQELAALSLFLCSDQARISGKVL